VDSHSVSLGTPAIPQIGQASFLDAVIGKGIGHTFVIDGDLFLLLEAWEIFDCASEACKIQNML